MRLVHTGIIGVFKKGDLFKLNRSGTILFQHLTASVGIVASDPKRMYEHDLDVRVKYYAYDVLVCGQLFMEIPSELLYRITKDEKNIK